MSWLRVDDKLVRHPKITKLSRADRWTWLEVLSYCAEYATEGHVSDSIRVAVPHAKSIFLARCHTLGLLDLNDVGYVVHNWAKYNPKDPGKAARQARYRDKLAAGGNSENDGENDGGVDASVDGGVDGTVDALVDASRVGARARPVPSPKEPLNQDPLLFPKTPPKPEARPDARATGFLTPPRNPADHALAPLEYLEALDHTAERGISE